MWLCRSSALLLVIAIGGWMFLGGSAKPAVIETPPTVAPLAEQVIPPADDVTLDPGTVPVENAFIEGQSGTTQPEDSAKAVVAATPEKKKTPIGEPAKPKPEAPKKVTVDDLINDN